MFSRNFLITPENEFYALASIEMIEDTNLASFCNCLIWSPLIIPARFFFTKTRKTITYILKIFPIDVQSFHILFHISKLYVEGRKNNLFSCNQLFVYDSFISSCQTISYKDHSFCFSIDFWLSFFIFIFTFILLTSRKATETLIHRVDNYPNLLPEMPRYYSPLVI